MPSTPRSPNSFANSFGKLADSNHPSMLGRSRVSTNLRTVAAMSRSSSSSSRSMSNSSNGALVVLAGAGAVVIVIVCFSRERLTGKDLEGVERVTDNGERLEKQAVGDRQRRQEPQHIAECARGQGQYAVGLAVPRDRGDRLAVRVASARHDQFGGDHRTATPDVPDDVRRPGDVAQLAKEDLTDRLCPGQQLMALDFLEHPGRGAEGARVAAVRAADPPGGGDAHAVATTGPRGKWQPARQTLGG